MFPVIVKGQREAAKLNNVLPEMTKLTNRMNEAKQSGNKFECQYLIPLYHFITCSVFTPLSMSSFIPPAALYSLVRLLVLRVLDEYTSQAHRWILPFLLIVTGIFWTIFH